MGYPCSVTCGGGITMRERQCIGGINMGIPTNEIKRCNTLGCPGYITIHGYWGSWGGYSFCPAGSFVYGYRLRVQRHLGFLDSVAVADDTALNDIELYCRKPNSGTVTKIIKSSSAPWGTWSEAHYCSGTNNPVVGMQGRMHGSGD